MMKDKKFSWGALHYAFKVAFGSSDVHSDSLLFDLSSTYNNHDVGWWSKLVNKACELGVSYHHRLELVVCLDAAQLELLDDVADLFEPMDIFVTDCVVVADNQEGASLEQNNFVGIDGLAEHS